MLTHTELAGQGEFAHSSISMQSPDIPVPSKPTTELSSGIGKSKLLMLDRKKKKEIRLTRVAFTSMAAHGVHTLRSRITVRLRNQAFIDINAARAINKSVAGLADAPVEI